MKKIAPWLIVVWITMLAVSIALIILGICIPAIRTLMFWLGFPIMSADIIWVAVFFILRLKPKKAKKSAAFIGNQMALQRIARDTDDAVSRYVNSVTRKGIMRKSAIYERPWFLLCGTSKAGKSSLLKGSGLNFPMKYPSESDGLLVEGSDQIMWYFANEAVWIDTPGTMMDEMGKDDWQALIHSLQRVRPINPVDGVALVVNTNEVLKSDDQGIKDLARRLRSRIDDLIALWGIEFPVYLIFNRTDEVPGFNEYFGEQFVRGQDQIFGATLPAAAQRAMPRAAFIEEYNLLCRSLTDIRLDKLYKERSEQNKRMICRFVIHFEGIQQKLGSLVAELFKPSNYEGKPLFRGFYFTSCYEKLPINQDTGVAIDKPSDMSMTIANHPLNPNKVLANDRTQPSQAPQGKKSEIKSIFVLPLFREIMIRDKSLVKTTQKRSRRELLQHYVLIAIMGVVALAVIGYVGICKYNSSKFLSSISNDLAAAPSEQSSLMDQYKSLDIIRIELAKLQKYEDRGAPFSMGLGFYKGGKVLEELKAIYFYRLKRFVVVPAVKYLEYNIQNGTSSYGELAGDQYDSLYRSLKAYLSISEAANSHPQDVDTIFLRNVMSDAIKMSLLATVGTSRLPGQVETILQDNMGMFLVYLKRHQFPKIQENQRLVEAARGRLKRLPSAASLYEAVIGKILPDSPQMTLDQILNRQGEGILKTSQTISALYTQQGYDQSVSDALTNASKNPFKIDWVIGLQKEDVPEGMLDEKQLRSEMANAYLEDFKGQWLSFLGSVSMDPFGDLQRSARILQKLVGERSELQVLLDAVAQNTVLKETNEAEAAGSAAIQMASKSKQLKGLQKAMKTADKVADQMQFSFGNGSPFDNLNASFDPIRSFSRSSSGALGGYEGYRDRVLTLVEKLGTIESQGESQALVVFSGKDDDPLLAGWKFTNSTLNSMPEEISAALRTLLLRPFEFTGNAASKVVSKNINVRWQNEIVKPFTSRFSGRFPFSPRGEDASFNDVMDFFRPTTGTYWGFYDRVLAPYIVKTETGWMVRQLGSLQVNFNPDLSASLSASERLRDIFFKADGKLRTLDITMTPASSNKNKAVLEMGSQRVELLPSGKPVRMGWPVEQQVAGAVLHIQASDNFTQDLNFSGPWGFMKLIQASKSNKMNNSTFSAKWQISVQNMYVVYIDTRVQVASTDNPFTDPVFSAFKCPATIVKE